MLKADWHSVSENSNRLDRRADDTFAEPGIDVGFWPKCHGHQDLWTVPSAPGRLPITT